jgi:ABC-type multidrug transport system ATPase subunit
LNRSPVGILIRSDVDRLTLLPRYLEEADELADRVAIIARGRIEAEGTPSTSSGRSASRVSRAMVGRSPCRHRTDQP